MNEKKKTKIPYVNLSKQFQEEKKELIKKIERVLLSGKYILSEELEKFEKGVCDYLKVKYCVGVNSGTDALILSLLSLNIGFGDEVITQSNSYIATGAAINAVGAKPVFIDVLNDQTMDSSKIKSVINKRTKAIIPVHLTGRMCEMDKILKMARKYNLKIIEDSAQSFGSTFHNKFSGCYGDCSAFSAHPLKNLNALGDAGFITTNNKQIFNFLKLKRNHGHINRDNIKFWGTVSRLDSIQATILNFRLKKIESIISQRTRNADLYLDYLNKKHFYYPNLRKGSRDTYHLFVIQVKKRDELKKFLLNNHIESNIHYPIPIHKQKFFIKKYKSTRLPNTEEQSKKILSLPINQFLKKEDIINICSKINYFYKDDN